MRREGPAAGVLTFSQDDHKVQCYLFAEPPRSQTSAQERNHSHGSRQCFHLLPSGFQSRHTTAIKAVQLDENESQDVIKEKTSELIN